MNQQLLIIMLFVYGSVVLGIVGFAILHFRLLTKNLIRVDFLKLLFSDKKKICVNEEEIRKLRIYRIVFASFVTYLVLVYVVKLMFIKSINL